MADFVVNQARVAATRLVEEHSLIRLSVEESRRLMAALLAPPRPATASMKRALKQYRKSVISDLTQFPGLPANNDAASCMGMNMRVAVRGRKPNFR